jgi:hypothetical protein
MPSDPDIPMKSTEPDASQYDLPPDILAIRRIRYIDDDDPEAQVTPVRSLTRQRSAMSIHSIHSGRRVDPAVSLPVAYRTVSFNITNTHERAAFEAKQKKDAAERSQ